MLKVLSWLNKDLSSSGVDTIQAIYEGLNEIMSKSKPPKALILIGKSLGDIAYTNFRSLLENILGRDIIIVHDLIDAVRLLDPLVSSGYDPLAITYVVPSKHVSIVNLSRNCEGKCLSIKHVSIARESGFYIVDSKTDLRAYYDFLSDVWIKKLKSVISSCRGVKSSEVCIAGYAPIPKVMIKVASSLGLNTNSLKSLMQTLKSGLEDAVLQSFKTLEQSISKCKNTLFAFLSPYMDVGLVMLISKE